jgi:hypothetical protein
LRAEGEQPLPDGRGAIHASNDSDGLLEEGTVVPGGTVFQVALEAVEHLDDRVSAGEFRPVPIPPLAVIVTDGGRGAAEVEGLLGGVGLGAGESIKGLQ